MTSGVLVDAFPAGPREVRETERLDVGLAPEPERPLDLDLDPETLAVEAVLVAAALALHRVEADDGVFQRAAPRVVHAHRVVRRDRPVEEPELGGAVPQLAEAREGGRVVPELQHRAARPRAGGSASRSWAPRARGASRLPEARVHSARVRALRSYPCVASSLSRASPCASRASPSSARAAVTTTTAVRNHGFDAGRSVGDCARPLRPAVRLHRGDRPRARRGHRGDDRVSPTRSSSPPTPAATR